MPRGQERQVVRGGQTAASGPIARMRQHGENRFLEAMRQQGATDRTAMQIDAQAQLAATQAANEDRRAAERIEADRLDRQFQEQLQTKMLTHQEQMEQSTRTYNESVFNKAFDLQENYGKEMVALQEKDHLLRRQAILMNHKLVLEAALRQADSMETTQKIVTQGIDRQKEYQVNRGAYESLRDSLTTMYQSDDLLSDVTRDSFKRFYRTEGGVKASPFDERVAELFQRTGTKVSPEMLRPENIDAAVAGGLISGQLTRKDISKVDTVLASMIDFFKERMEAATKPGRKEGAAAALRQVQAWQLNLDRLTDKTKPTHKVRGTTKTVGELIREVQGVRRGDGYGAILDEAIQEAGSEDLQAWRDRIEGKLQQVSELLGPDSLMPLGDW